MPTCSKSATLEAVTSTNPRGFTSPEPPYSKRNKGEGGYRKQMLTARPSCCCINSYAWLLSCPSCELFSVVRSLLKCKAAAHCLECFMSGVFRAKLMVAVEHLEISCSWQRLWWVWGKHPLSKPKKYTTALNSDVIAHSQAVFQLQSGLWKSFKAQRLWGCWQGNRKTLVILHCLRGQEA